MPRPTTAQIASGSLTVVLATTVLLSATGARSGAAVAGLGTAALLLGLLVAALVGQPARRVRAATAGGTGTAPAAPPAPAAHSPAPAATTVPRARIGGGARASRATEHSLRR